MLTEALEYSKKGFSIIPVGVDKKPLISWEKYQKEIASEDQIKEWWDKYPEANIGVVTGMISGIAVIDIDTEEGIKAIQEYIPDTSLFPISQTPSGGRHYFFKCPDSNLRNNTRLVEGCDLRANGGYVVLPPSINGNKKEYKWLIPLKSISSIPSLPDKYVSYIKQYLYNYINKNYKEKMSQTEHQRFKITPKSNKINNLDAEEYVEGVTNTRQNRDITPQSVTMRDNEGMFCLGRRDNDLFHVANVMTKGGSSVDEVRQVLEILAQNCNPPFPRREIEAKVLSALKRTERREGALSHEVHDYIITTDGYFTTTDIYKALHLHSRKDQANVRQILSRLSADGAIEKYGRKDGQYRRIDKTEDVIDIFEESDSVLPIKWPFDIQDFVEIMPRNIAVIAGASNAGKTAFLLNVAEMNMDKFKINYFVSEMGGGELRKRIQKFGPPYTNRKYDDWKKVHFIERSSNFSDLIRPNEMNIIDFLELHEDFWKVGGLIKDIYDKLEKGICILAIQKDPQKEYGLGASRGLDKARLYLTMDFGRLKIMKAKMFAQENVNPNGYVLDFKIIYGCHFLTETGWRKEEPLDFTQKGGKYGKQMV